MKNLFCGLVFGVMSLFSAAGTLHAQAPSATAPTSGEAGQQEYDAGKLPTALGLEAARFRWWAPEGVKVRGVLVLLPGRGGDARGMVTQEAWQKLAQEWQFGIMGCQLKNPADEPFTYQHDPNGGISDLLNKAVNVLLTQNKQPIKNPPLCFWGHSAGGNVSQHYATRHPERVVAAVLARAPGGPGNLSAGKESVPMLVLIGKKDKPEWVTSSTEAYEKGNALNAVWTLAAHPNEGHGVGATQELSGAFLTAAVQLRLPPLSPFQTSAAVRPKKLSRQQCWLGNTENYEITPSSQYKGKKYAATWLPDEATAKVWQRYMQN